MEHDPIILGAEARFDPRLRSKVWRDATAKALPAGYQPPTSGQWREEYKRFLREAGSLSKRFGEGSLSAEDFIDQFDALLADSHARSWYLGRVLAGDDSPMDDRDLIAGRVGADQDGYYLQGLKRDLEGGRYFVPNDAGDLEFDGEALDRRLRLYGNKTRGAANEAFAENSPPDLTFDWVLGAAEHCPDCVDLAESSPWMQDELYTYPGDGSTQCLTNCRCRLVRSDGVEGFDAEH